MEKLKTNYMGLEINSPLILSSSGLSKKTQNIIRAEEKGVGAIILKSLFEEQINFISDAALYDSVEYPEAADYVKNYSRHNFLNEYLDLIRTSVKAVKIPVIASINCVSDTEWEGYAKEIEKAGAHGLELNMNVFHYDYELTSAQIEQKYLDIIKKVQASTNLPIAIKMGKTFTNLPYFIKQIKFRGIQNFVLFNRFYKPIINIDKMEMKSSSPFSNEIDIKESLRSIAIVKGMMPDIEISASTGIHNANGAIQLLLAGASSLQLCSVLYKHGFNEIKTINAGILKWMEEKGFNSIDEFKAKLSYSNIKDPSIYERFQFIQHISSIE